MRWDEPDGRGRLRSESVESQIRKSGRCPSCACGPAGWISDPAGRPPHWARPEPSRLQIVDPLAVTGHTEKHPGFPVGRTTCPGDVPADPADWRLHAGPSTGSPTPHQDWHRGTQTPHTLENGQRLARLFPLCGNFPESCPAPVADSSSRAWQPRFGPSVYSERRIRCFNRNWRTAVPSARQPRNA